MQQIYQGLPVLGRRFRWPQVVLGLLDQAEDGGGWVLSTIRSARRYAARSPRCRPTWVRTCSRPPNTMTAPVGRRLSSPAGALPELVAAAVAGNRTAWDALVERFASLVSSVTRRSGVSPSDADHDAAQPAAGGDVADPRHRRAPETSRLRRISRRSRPCGAGLPVGRGRPPDP